MQAIVLPSATSFLFRTRAGWTYSSEKTSAPTMATSFICPLSGRRSPSSRAIPPSSFRTLPCLGS